MGKDVWGQNWGAGQDKSGCLCEDFCSELDSMPDEDSADFNQRRNTLTCQKKSELLLNCTCGHPCFTHHRIDAQLASEDGPSQSRTAMSVANAGEWAAILSCGDKDLLHLGPLLVAKLSVADAYSLLHAGRTSLISSLKTAVGINSITERQQVANALGRLERERALEEARQAKRRMQNDVAGEERPS